jgi:SH3 domain-containing YSC84-like protein 1
MKLVIVSLLLLGLVLPARAIDKAEVDKRIRLLTTKFEELQNKADRRVPAESLRKACGIILLNRSKGGFVFAFEGGSGLAMVKDAKSGKWSPPTFMSSSEASLGLQAGGQQAYIVILLMNTNATQALTGSVFKFGGEASGTAGDASGKAESTTGPESMQLTQIYSDKAGLYGGVAVKGGSVSPDADANLAYYGDYLTPAEILFEHKGKATEAANTLAQKLTQAAQ